MKYSDVLIVAFVNHGHEHLGHKNSKIFVLKSWELIKETLNTLGKM